MCEDNFRFVYKPQKNLSVDESACTFKGRLRFKVYNPHKPVRFHIKLCQMYEAASGYICGFSVYTSKGSCTEPGLTLNPDCGTTMRTVMTWRKSVRCLTKGTVCKWTTFTHHLNYIMSCFTMTLLLSFQPN